MKIETGVMVMKNGKAWGVTYKDEKSTSYGWVEPVDAPIHDPKYCEKPENLTYSSSPYAAELRTGKIVKVERRTEMRLLSP